MVELGVAPGNRGEAVARWLVLELLLQGSLLTGDRGRLSSGLVRICYM